MYKTYCDWAKVAYPFSQRVFKEELKNYFRDFNDSFDFEDGSRVRSYYSGFRTEIFEQDKKEKKQEEKNERRIEFKSGIKSIFDEVCKD